MTLRGFFGLIASAVSVSAGCAVGSASATILFNGDWTGFGSEFAVGGPGTTYMNGQPIGWQAGHGPSHWLLIQEKGLSRMVPVVDPTTPGGRTALKVTVLPGDNLGYTGERAEVSDMLGPTDKHLDVTPATGPEFYAFAVKVPTSWQPPTSPDHNTWGLVLQLHAPDPFDAPPALALAIQSDYHLALCGGDLLQGGALKVNKNSYPVSFSDGSLRPGHWVVFLLDVAWATGPTGHIVVYRRDEGATSFRQVLSLQNIATLETRYGTPTTSPHYWKMGYYRSISAGITSQLLLGPLIRGQTFNEVASEVFAPK